MYKVSGRRSPYGETIRLEARLEAHLVAEVFFLGMTLHLERVIKMLEALLAGSQICQIDALLFVGVDVTDHMVDGLSEKNMDSSLACW